MTRTIALTSILLVAAFRLTAQETSTAAPATTTAAETTTTAVSTKTPEQIRDGFNQVLRRHSSNVARILSVDPTMLNNEPFLARYPELAEYVAKNPELRRNPHYYVTQYEYSQHRPEEPFEEAVETMMIIATFALIAFALAWLIRTIIEQKRWNQLSRRQAEVHNKILDRFGSSEEVLAYIKSPAGAKFLESAPIPLHAEKATENAPTRRIMWSIQLGVVMAVAALGMLLGSLRFDGDSGKGFFAMGLIAFSIGAGFIASAVVSLAMSKRLGLWQGPDAESLTVADDSVR